MEHNRNGALTEAPAGRGEITYYTVAQVAQRYGVCNRIIYQALQKGRIKGFRMGGWRVSEESLREFERSGGFARQTRTEEHPRARGSGTRRRAPGPVVRKIQI